MPQLRVRHDSVDHRVAPRLRGVTEFEGERPHVCRTGTTAQLSLRSVSSTSTRTVPGSFNDAEVLLTSRASRHPIGLSTGQPKASHFQRVCGWHTRAMVMISFSAGGRKPPTEPLQVAHPLLGLSRRSPGVDEGRAARRVPTHYARSRTSPMMLAWIGAGRAAPRFIHGEAFYSGTSPSLRENGHRCGPGTAAAAEMSVRSVSGTSTRTVWRSHALTLRCCRPLARRGNPSDVPWTTQASLAHGFRGVYR